MSELRWDDVRFFLATARAGTLTAAAEALGVNGSTVHRRVASFEEALGTTVFLKQARGYVLTEVGEALLERAAEVEESVASLRRTAVGHDRHASGPVRLTVPRTLVPHIAPALASLVEACPNVRPIVAADHRLLALGHEADLALRPGPDRPEQAVGRRVGTIAWSVHRRAEVEPDAPWVVYAEGTGPSAARAWWRAHHAAEPVVAEVTTVAAMASLLEALPARGLLPRYLGRSHPDLVAGAPLESVAGELWLLIHADLRRSARVRAVVDHLLPALERVAPLLLS